MTKSLEINASPTKRFFVDMLTRDIELDDAILDLLDNSVDGILRLRKGKRPTTKPYEGYWAELKFSRGEFRITDNCGGIPPDVAAEYAFRMGRLADDDRDKNLPTVGMYGIGMKRAMFKMGSSTVVESHHVDGSFRVELTPTWLKRDEDWSIPARRYTNKSAERGTTIIVKNLSASIADQFARDSDFQDAFIERLQTTYALIIEKGFKVTVNGHVVTPKPVKFLFAQPKKGQKTITPYMYEVDIGKVHASLVVGFYKANADEEEYDEEAAAKHSRETAGWTVICNDRVVLYCDKTRMTGWGDAEVPGFHAQFNAISGVLELSSPDPNQLPLTTTKRGIDGNSEVYLLLKQYMREGTKIFTSYTYKWKKAKPEARKNEGAAAAVTLQEVRSQMTDSDWKPVKKGGKRYMPDLPEPEKKSEDVVVRFTKPVKQVTSLGRRLLDSPSAKPGDVGSAAFDFAHQKA
jgi:hypothetical protein